MKYIGTLVDVCIAKGYITAQFASTDCPFRMSGAGSSVEAVWVSG